MKLPKQYVNLKFLGKENTKINFKRALHTFTVRNGLPKTTPSRWIYFTLKNLFHHMKYTVVFERLLHANIVQIQE